MAADDAVSRLGLAAGALLDRAYPPVRDESLDPLVASLPKRAGLRRAAVNPERREGPLNRD